MDDRFFCVDGSEKDVWFSSGRLSNDLIVLSITLRVDDGPRSRRYMSLSGCGVVNGIVDDDEALIFQKFVTPRIRSIT